VAGFVARRIVALVPLLLLVSIIIFAFVLLLGGNPARELAGGLNAPESRVQDISAELHLDEPFFERYGRWLGDAVQGDLGESLFSGREVTSEIQNRFPVTVSVAFGAIVFAILIGIPLGIAAGTRPGSVVDRAITFGSSLGIAIPDFFIATALVVLLAVENDVLPAIHYVDFADSPLEWAEHLLMPWIALGLALAATLARQVRGSVIDVMSQEYVRTARATGLRERRVIGKHALKNALTPAVTILGLQIGYLLGGTIIIEYIFSLPGLGTYLIVEGFGRTDLPVIQGGVLVIATVFLLVNLVVDIVYGVLNPKVRAT
jgi:peptide/nickel transport system permease protein